MTEFDYSRNGTYFVTICTKDKQRIFWDNHTVAETSTDKSVGDGALDVPNKQLSYNGRDNKFVGDGALDVPNKQLSYNGRDNKFVGDGALDVPNIQLSDYGKIVK
ncbi:MAG: hypothetical protein LUF26_00970, partial [Firmicutes bacterium]|nr:hypothetical protein [Bacillota bacterium]